MMTNAVLAKKIQPLTFIGLSTAIGMSVMVAGCDNLSEDIAKQAAKENQAKKELNAAPSNVQVVTIYSSRNEQLIKPLLNKYSNKTGTTIELVTDSSGPLIQRLQAEGSSTPADMFLTVDAGNLWQAAEKGLLQPITSSIIESNVPARYRDPDNRWTGLSLRARTIFYNPKKVKKSELSTYEDLGNPRWKGKLCLRTSKKVYNQSLVASMIHNLGEGRAAFAVKGWVKNLKTDVFADDVALLKAIDSGQCAIGIANTYYYGRMLDENPNLNLKVFWANQGTSGVHINVSGAGVVTNADNAGEALKLIEWLSSDEAQDVYSSADKEYPVKDGVPVSPMLKKWGGFVPDPMNVGLFGEMQSQSIQLMDKAKYK